VTANLNRQPGTQQITDIEASLASAQTASANATTLNTQTQSTLQGMLQGIEGVDQNKIGVEILTLQNNLSASMSVTAPTGNPRRIHPHRCGAALTSS
jgi:hypothetical protein